MTDTRERIIAGDGMGALEQLQSERGQHHTELRTAVDLLRKVTTPGDLYEVLDDVQDFVATYDAQHPEGK